MVKLVKKETDLEIQSDEKSLLASLTVNNVPISADYIDLPAVVGALRKLTNKTTQQLADELNAHQSNISNFEHGKRSFNFSNLEKLLEAMGYKYSILIEPILITEDKITSDNDSSPFIPEDLRFDFLACLEK